MDHAGRAREGRSHRSTEVASEEFPDSISWIRSYVVEESDGGLGTVCIYQASDPDAVRSRRPGRDARPEVLRIADTVVVRPDPVAA